MGFLLNIKRGFWCMLLDIIRDIHNIRLGLNVEESFVRLKKEFDQLEEDDSEHLIEQLRICVSHLVNTCVTAYLMNQQKKFITVEYCVLLSIPYAKHINLNYLDTRSSVIISNK